MNNVEKQFYELCRNSNLKPYLDQLRTVGKKLNLTIQIAGHGALNKRFFVHKPELLAIYNDARNNTKTTRQPKKSTIKAATDSTLSNSLALDGGNVSTVQLVVNTTLPELLKYLGK